MEMAALPMESVSSEDTSGKLFCYLISAPLPPVRLVFTLAPFLASTCTSPILVTHRLMGCPRPPNCLNCPLTRLLSAGFASDHSFSCRALCCLLWQSKRQTLGSNKSSNLCKNKSKMFQLGHSFSVTFSIGKKRY